MNQLSRMSRALFLTALVAVPAAQAGDAAMTWRNPESFTDLDSGDAAQKSFSKGVEKAFNAELGELAGKLPKGYRLEIDFTDIDLAGEVDPVYLRDYRQVRILKDVYFPQLSFDYRVLDAAGRQVAGQQGVTLKDMGYLNGPKLGNSNMAFYYERRMLREWFGKTVLPAVK